MSKRLLCIDDNYIDIAIIKNHQAKSNTFEDVKYYMDAKSAIKFLKDNMHKPTELPDVIFLDLYMDSFSGWDFLDEYNQISGTLAKEITIHIVSFSILPKDISRSKNYSCVTSYFPKPMTQKAFQVL
ncbi:response regulator [Mucilaginibacter dorajii]|uniref:Response regulator n=1 Tax=Mucilaginibacter dorajii TaxID=692994 RepID=A0ABP7P010_9SPHI|nr:response regulator [Mucilaginibacter dorajii]MCS3735621.1 CheY-like chemotaxis protein [Mucilaginibacter dorajii]